MRAPWQLVNDVADVAVTAAGDAAACVSALAAGAVSSGRRLCALVDRRPEVAATGALPSALYFPITSESTLLKSSARIQAGDNQDEVDMKQKQECKPQADTAMPRTTATSAPAPSACRRLGLPCRNSHRQG